MALDCSLWAYPWDLIDEGPDAALAAVRQTAGANAVSVATSYHSVEHLRPHGARPAIYRSEGAVYFRPDPTFFKDTPIVPHPAAMAGDGDPLARIAEASQRAGLALRSWTVCCHNSELGHRYPQFTPVDCLGSRNPAALCPAQSAARAYLVALARNLTERYPIQWLELESASFMAPHAHGHEKVGVDLGCAEQLALALCFCEACVARGRQAGADTDALQLGLRGILFRAFETGRAAPAPDTMLDALPGLAAFQLARQETVLSLLAEIRAASRAPILAYEMGDPALAGAGTAAATPYVDGVMALAYTASEEGVAGTFARTARDAGGSAKAAIGLCAYGTASPDPAALAATVRAAWNAGARRFNFYNYGIMPHQNLDWIRRALAALPAA